MSAGFVLTGASDSSSLSFLKGLGLRAAFGFGAGFSSAGGEEVEAASANGSWTGGRAECGAADEPGSESDRATALGFAVLATRAFFGGEGLTSSSSSASLPVEDELSQERFCQGRRRME